MGWRGKGGGSGLLDSIHLVLHLYLAQLNSKSIPMRQDLNNWLERATSSSAECLHNCWAKHCHLNAKYDEYLHLERYSSQWPSCYRLHGDTWITRGCVALPFTLPYPHNCDTIYMEISPNAMLFHLLVWRSTSKSNSIDLRLRSQTKLERRLTEGSGAPSHKPISQRRIAKWIWGLVAGVGSWLQEIPSAKPELGSGAMYINKA